MDLDRAKHLIEQVAVADAVHDGTLEPEPGEPDWPAVRAAAADELEALGVRVHPPARPGGPAPVELLRLEQELELRRRVLRSWLDANL
jgi:hypothetical protein